MSAARSVPLPAIPTTESATVALPHEIEAGLAEFLDPVLEAPGWTARMAVINAYASVMPSDNRWQVEAQSRLITAALEQLAERDISSTEAAITYRLSSNLAWREAAKRYLDAVPDAIIPMLESYPGVGVFACQFLALECAGDDDGLEDA
jgi:hypothetical protein